MHLNSNIITYGLLSILLSICGFLLLTGLRDNSNSVELLNIGSKRYICNRGGPEWIEVNRLGGFKYHNQNFTLRSLREHLIIHNDEMPYNMIVLNANGDLPVDYIMEVTDSLKGTLLGVQISWESDLQPNKKIKQD